MKVKSWQRVSLFSHASCERCSKCCATAPASATTRRLQTTQVSDKKIDGIRGQKTKVRGWAGGDALTARATVRDILAHEHSPARQEYATHPAAYQCQLMPATSYKPFGMPTKVAISAVNIHTSA